MLYGPPGFITVPTPDSVAIAARPLPGDPLAGALNSPVGGLAIEPSTRRPMRLNRELFTSNLGVTISLEQVFSNCPKYIATRDVEAVAPTPASEPVRTSALDARARELLAAADTAFVATRGLDGLDVSHRGGRPGFLQTPDRARSCGPTTPATTCSRRWATSPPTARRHTVVDPADGTTLHVSGHAEVDESRTITFTVDAVVRRERVAPLRWRLERPARNPPLATLSEQGAPV